MTACVMTTSYCNAQTGSKYLRGPEFDGWIFTADDALRAHKNYQPADFYKLDQYTRYTTLHFSEFVKTATIYRDGGISNLEISPMPQVANVKAKTNLGELTLDDYIKKSEMQGIIVLYRGKIVYERYPRMMATDKHIFFSISKTFVATAIALLEDEGKLNTNNRIGKYLPQLDASDWGNIKIIDILNMTAGMTGLQFDDPEAQIDSNNSYFKFASHMGLTRKTKAVNTSIWDILNGMQKQKEPGTAFEYTSVNTVVLTLLIEKVTGKRYADFISERIWKKIGAEADGYIGLSQDGITSTSAMMNTTLRDLARYGLLFTPSWRTVSKQKIISAAYIKRIQKGGALPSAFDQGVFGKNVIQGLGEKPDHNGYQWDAIMHDGDFIKTGMNGQGLYVSPSKDLVIACFAHNTNSSIGYLRAIAKSGYF